MSEHGSTKQRKITAGVGMPSGHDAGLFELGLALAELPQYGIEPLVLIGDVDQERYDRSPSWPAEIPVADFWATAFDLGRADREPVGRRFTFTLGGKTMEVELMGGPGEDDPEPGYYRPVTVTFADGSGATLSSNLERYMGWDERDAGPGLLEPVTEEELAGTEVILGELYRAAGLDELTADQERRILDLADLIRWQHHQMDPDETPRWTLVGVTKAVLLRLAVEVPIAVLSDQIGLTLNQMGWHNIAHGLVHGIA